MQPQAKDEQSIEIDQGTLWTTHEDMKTRHLTRK